MPEAILWTPQMINRFRDGLSRTGFLHKMNLSALAGPRLLALVRPFLAEGASCLDHGGGDGDFARVLMKNGFKVAFYEPSKDRSAIVESLFEGNPRFLGTVGESARRQFEHSFCLEVIEHVHPDELERFLVGLNRGISVGGTLVLSCPHAEDLDLQSCYCPVCDSTFHRWQHLRSVRPAMLRHVLEAAGFETVWQGLAGFEDAGLIERFLDAGTEAWPDKRADEVGRLLPLIGQGDRIVHVARKRRDVDAVPQAALDRFLGRADAVQRVDAIGSDRAGLREIVDVVVRLLAEERPDGRDVALVVPDASGRRLQIFRIRDFAGPFRRHDGHMWSVPVPDLAAFAADAPGRDGTSPVVLLEDGRPLPAPDSDHEDIARDGAGRFSHRGEAIYFSTSDNSDPNENGRRFRVVHPAAEDPDARSSPAGGRPEERQAARDPIRLHEGMTAVFAGAPQDYWTAVASGLLPEFAELRLLDGARRARPARVPIAGPTAASEPAGPVRTHAGLSSRIAAGLERRLGHRAAPLHAALLGLAKSPWARRAQHLVDRRENALARLLADPGEFPYRLRHVVPGRVVLAISSLHNGGAERQVVYTATGLGRRGFDDVHILAEYLRNPGNDFYLADARKAASSVTDVSDAPNPASAWLGKHPELVGIVHGKLANRALNIAEYLQRISPEVVHISLDWTNVAVGLAAVLAGVPHILVSGRNLAPWHFGFFNWFMYPAYRALLRRPNVRMLNNTEAGARDYAAWLRIPAEGIQVLRNGVDVARFRPANPGRRLQERDALGVPRNAKLVAAAFRFSDEKRPFMWIEAAAKIHAQDPDAWFVLCGGGPLGYAAKQLAWNLGLGERILFPGVVEDMSRIYAAADLVMLASLKEGTPNVLIEAQAMGVPVVATAAYGSAETVDDGVTGRIVRNETAHELADAALELLGDAAFRERARQAGPDFVERRFGLERMADDTLALYRAMGAALRPVPAPEPAAASCRESRSLSAGERGSDPRSADATTPRPEDAPRPAEMEVC